MIELKVTTASGQEVIWSYQMDLIMLHGDFISAQWEPDCLGVEILKQEHNVKVGMHTIGGGNHYQSWYFEIKDYEALLGFFKKLRYPCQDTNPFNY